MSTKHKTPAASAKKRPRGRPSKRTPELCREICDRLSRGESLATICADAHMPDTSNVREWLRKDEEFQADYARAREAQAEFYADEIVKIADDCTDAGKARLQMDARKWYASKLAPKRYGDKIDVNANVTGEVKIIVGGDAS